jgi:hypothetical protein
VEDFAAVRHKIVHDQKDAKRNFNLTSVAIAGRTFPRARPRNLLRELSTGVPFWKWLDIAASDLLSIAGQMV